MFGALLDMYGALLDMYGALLDMYGALLDMYETFLDRVSFRKLSRVVGGWGGVGGQLEECRF